MILKDMIKDWPQRAGVARRKQLNGRDRQAKERSFFIGDLSREFGVTLRTLRFYEDRGLLTPQRKRSKRVYSARDRGRLATILKGKRLGFTLGEISGMIAAEESRPGSTGDLRMSIDQIEEQIAHLERQKSELEAALDELRGSREFLTLRLAAG